MFETIVNTFWIMASCALALVMLCLIAFFIWKAMDMVEEDNAKRAADPAKETKDLKFTGVSRWEMSMQVARLLREDKKRQARKGRYGRYGRYA